MNNSGKPAVTELNPHLICSLCRGYFINATTIIECLHTFCKSCIVSYFEASKFCPICDVQVHKTKPFLSIRPDKTLQNIVYKLVPGLYKNEMCRRKRFYSQHNDKGPSSEEDGGNHMNQPYILPDDTISIALKPLINQDNNEVELCTRFFNCPASVNVAQLKRLLRAKFDLPMNHPIQLLANEEETLKEHYSLIDVAYMNSWLKNEPLVLFYKIFFAKKIKFDPEISDRVIPLKVKQEFIKVEDTPKHTSKVEYPLQVPTGKCLLENKNMPLITTFKDETRRDHCQIIVNTTYDALEKVIKDSEIGIQCSTDLRVSCTPTFKTIVPAPIKASKILNIGSLSIPAVDSITNGSSCLNYGLGLIANSNGILSNIYSGSIIDASKFTGTTVLPFGLTLAPNLFCTSYQDQHSLSNLTLFSQNDELGNNLLLPLTTLNNPIIPVSTIPQQTIPSALQQPSILFPKESRRPKYIRPKEEPKPNPDKEVQLMITEAGVMLVSGGDNQANHLETVMNSVESEANELLNEIENDALLSANGNYSEDSNKSDGSDTGERLAQIKQEISTILDTLSKEANENTKLISTYCSTETEVPIISSTSICSVASSTVTPIVSYEAETGSSIDSFNVSNGETLNLNNNIVPLKIKESLPPKEKPQHALKVDSSYKSEKKCRRKSFSNIFQKDKLLKPGSSKNEAQNKVGSILNTIENKSFVSLVQAKKGKEPAKLSLASCTSSKTTLTTSTCIPQLTTVSSKISMTNPTPGIVTSKTRLCDDVSSNKSSPLKNIDKDKKETNKMSRSVVKEEIKKKGNRKYQPIGYKTLKKTPKGWNPTIPREKLPKKCFENSPKTNKFFKARNSCVTEKPVCDVDASSNSGGVGLHGENSVGESVVKTNNVANIVSCSNNHSPLSKLNTSNSLQINARTGCNKPEKLKFEAIVSPTKSSEKSDLEKLTLPAQESLCLTSKKASDVIFSSKELQKEKITDSEAVVKCLGKGKKKIVETISINDTFMKATKISVEKSEINANIPLSPKSTKEGIVGIEISSPVTEKLDKVDNITKNTEKSSMDLVKSTSSNIIESKTISRHPPDYSSAKQTMKLNTSSINQLRDSFQNTPQASVSSDFILSNAGTFSGLSYDSSTQVYLQTIASLSSSQYQGRDQIFPNFTSPYSLLPYTPCPPVTYSTSPAKLISPTTSTTDVTENQTKLSFPDFPMMQDLMFQSQGHPSKLDTAKPISESHLILNDTPDNNKSNNLSEQNKLTTTPKVSVDVVNEKKENRKKIKLSSCLKLNGFPSQIKDSNLSQVNTSVNSTATTLATNMSFRKDLQTTQIESKQSSKEYDLLDNSSTIVQNDKPKCTQNSPSTDYSKKISITSPEKKSNPTASSPCKIVKKPQSTSENVINIKQTETASSEPEVESTKSSATSLSFPITNSSAVACEHYVVADEAIMNETSKSQSSLPTQPFENISSCLLNTAAGVGSLSDTSEMSHSFQIEPLNIGLTPQQDPVATPSSRSFYNMQLPLNQLGCLANQAPAIDNSSNASGQIYFSSSVNLGTEFPQATPISTTVNKVGSQISNQVTHLENSTLSKVSAETSKQSLPNSISTSPLPKNIDSAKSPLNILNNLVSLVNSPAVCVPMPFSNNSSSITMEAPSHSQIELPKDEKVVKCGNNTSFPIKNMSNLNSTCSIIPSSVVAETQNISEINSAISKVDSDSVPSSNSNMLKNTTICAANSMTTCSTSEVKNSISSKMENLTVSQQATVMAGQNQEIMTSAEELDRLLFQSISAATCKSASLSLPLEMSSTVTSAISQTEDIKHDKSFSKDLIQAQVTSSQSLLKSIPTTVSYTGQCASYNSTTLPNHCMYHSSSAIVCQNNSASTSCIESPKQIHAMSKNYGNQCMQENTHPRSTSITSVSNSTPRQELVSNNSLTTNLTKKQSAGYPIVSTQHFMPPIAPVYTTEACKISLQQHSQTSRVGSESSKIHASPVAVSTSEHITKINLNPVLGGHDKREIPLSNVSIQSSYSHINTPSIVSNSTTSKKVVHQSSANYSDTSQVQSPNAKVNYNQNTQEFSSLPFNPMMNNYQDGMSSVGSPNLSSSSSHKNASQFSWDGNPFLFNSNSFSGANKGFATNTNNCVQQNLMRNNESFTKDANMNVDSQSNFMLPTDTSCSKNQTMNAQYNMDNSKKNTQNTDSYNNFPVSSKNYNASNSALYNSNYNNNYMNFFSNSQSQVTPSLSSLVSGAGYNFPLSNSKFNSSQQYFNFGQNMSNNSYFPSTNFNVNCGSNYQNCMNQSSGGTNPGSSNMNSNFGNNFSGSFCNFPLSYYSNCSFSYNSYPYLYQGGDMSLLSNHAVAAASLMPSFSPRSSLSPRSSSSSQSFNDLHLQSGLFPMMPFVSPLSSNGSRGASSPMSMPLSPALTMRPFSNTPYPQKMPYGAGQQANDFPKSSSSGSKVISTSGTKHKKSNSQSQGSSKLKGSSNSINSCPSNKPSSEFSKGLCSTAQGNESALQHRSFNTGAVQSNCTHKSVDEKTKKENKSSADNQCTRNKGQTFKGGGGPS